MGFNNLFETGKNCWRTARARHISILVDYGNYYRDLRESIIRAQHSIFILGWDIDSRIELLRGDDAEAARAPTCFFDLICWKARENPQLQIYLNRWDYSMFFAKQREPFAAQHWNAADLPNIHFCMDDVLPLAACHHQKVAVIDDEVAFWGGMDIALARWDFRQHHVKNKNRVDPGQLPHPGEQEPFGPYHDIQAVMCGPAVAAMSELVRMRWNAAAPKDRAIGVNPGANRDLPPTWPKSDPPDFTDIDTAIARTLPKTHAWPQVEEIAQMWPAEIARAEKFIYIENQFLACPVIADALNKRLHERPDLRVLAISCYKPQGIMERKAMWTGRVRFRDAVERGGVWDRIALAYPACREDEKEIDVRIHSKLMIIDDRVMHLGSANINCRSLGADSECDVIMIGADAAARHKIAAVRNDLIREHTGFECADIARIIETGSIQDFLIDRATSRQHLRAINDEAYRHEKFAALATRLADPRRPIIPQVFTHVPVRLSFGMKGKTIGAIIAAILVAIGLSLLWSHSPLAQYASVAHLSALMEKIRNSPVAYIWVMGIYIISAPLFLPVTAITGAVIIVFGGVKGFFLSMVGAMAAGLTGYYIGTATSRERLYSIFPRARKIVNRLCDSGVIGVVVIRLLPIAPYSLINIAFGVVRVPVYAFLMGTFLGLLPGKLMLAMFGQSLLDVFRHPEPRNIALAVLGFAAWLAVVVGCNRAARAWQSRAKAA